MGTPEKQNLLGSKLTKIIWKLHTRVLEVVVIIIITMTRIVVLTVKAITIILIMVVVTVVVLVLANISSDRLMKATLYPTLLLVKVQIIIPIITLRIMSILVVVVVKIV